MVTGSGNRVTPMTGRSIKENNLIAIAVNLSPVSDRAPPVQKFI